MLSGSIIGFLAALFLLENANWGLLIGLVIGLVVDAALLKSHVQKQPSPALSPEPQHQNFATSNQGSEAESGPETTSDQGAPSNEDQRVTTLKELAKAFGPITNTAVTNTNGLNIVVFIGFEPSSGDLTTRAFYCSDETSSKLSVVAAQDGHGAVLSYLVQACHPVQVISEQGAHEDDWRVAYLKALVAEIGPIVDARPLPDGSYFIRLIAVDEQGKMVACDQHGRGDLVTPSFHCPESSVQKAIHISHEQGTEALASYLIDALVEMEQQC